MKAPDPNLLPIYESEQREHVERLRSLLEQAAGAPAGPALEEALRRAHTLKGAARAVGLEAIELLAHRLETVFARVRTGSLSAGRAQADAMIRVLDTMDDVLASALGRNGEPDIAGALTAMDEALGAAPKRPKSLPETPEPLPEAPPEAHPRTAPEPAPDMMRVSTAHIDALVHSASQLYAAAGVQIRASAAIEEHFRHLQDVSREWSHMRQAAAAALKKHEGDTTLTRISDSLDYVDALLGSLAAESRGGRSELQRSAWELRRRAETLYGDATLVRMTPAESVFGGFRRMIRDLARDEGKEIEFRAEGLETQADRLVLQALKDPVMHLLRNAASHGIEPPRERAAKGKRTEGTVVLRLEPRGGSLNLTVEDDGRGVDPARIAEVAESKGLLTRAAAAAQSPEELMRLILLPGFSTAESVSTLAGRGMGLAVVQDAVDRLHGTLTVVPRTDGTAIRISVPLSISTHQVVIVKCAGYTYGIPARAVERLCRVKLADIEHVDGNEAVRTESGPAPLARLADLLGIAGGTAQAPPDPDEPAETVSVMVLDIGEQRLGLAVDALADDREAIVADLGLPAEIAGFSAGGIVLEDGSVAVVLNPAALLRRFRESGRLPALRPVTVEPQKAPPTILVVDDSITTRSLEKSILEAHGYRVRIAVDGLDALEQLRAQTADLVIADVMMPRMDGLELLAQMKKDPALAGIPFIVVSSIERREEQERGLSLGAGAYIVKHKFDQRELIRIVRQIL